MDLADTRGIIAQELVRLALESCPNIPLGLDCPCLEHYADYYRLEELTTCGTVMYFEQNHIMVIDSRPLKTRYYQYSSPTLMNDLLSELTASTGLL